MELDREKQLFAQRGCQHVKDEIAELAEKIGHREKTISSLSRQILDETRSLALWRKKRVFLEQYLSEAETALQENLERIQGLAEVEGAKVTEAGLEVVTGPVSIFYDGVNFKIGKFKIRLTFDGDLSIHNVDNQSHKPAWDHPHIQGGYPCLGNLGPGLMKLVGEYEWFVAVTLVLDYLKIYDPDSAYCPIDLWPINGQ